MKCPNCGGPMDPGSKAECHACYKKRVSPKKRGRPKKARPVSALSGIKRSKGTYSLKPATWSGLVCNCGAPPRYTVTQARYESGGGFEMVFLCDDCFLSRNPSS